jgi:hypothetical protein
MKGGFSQKKRGVVQRNDPTDQRHSSSSEEETL